ncbi:OsmC family protein [Tellurirhabdus rosea]|uniref:OsmC family protein n=1 Tax=Tellurirhabdus rosea TaxID=2674997 RepID=UPI00225B3537|nr:OsmC family protein [Tellurirhabdus rosea]
MNNEQTVTHKKMKTMTVELNRVDDAFHFEAAGVSGVPVHLDGSTDIGGHNLGARPMELLLMGLAGCSAIDVVLILQKQRQRIDEFRITVEGDRSADATPAPFESIRLHYYLKGEISEDKARRAIDLSMDKYCSATAQLRPSARISYDLTIL